MTTRPIPELTEAEKQRFWSKVDIRGPEECWPWKGTPNSYGYGRFKLREHNPYAHRIAMQLHLGRASTLLTCHHCDNPPCCNPAHLFEGSTLDNTRDAANKGRMPKGDKHRATTHPETIPRGEKHWKSKLTEDDVRFIREQRASGVTLEVLGRRFNIGTSGIHKIATRCLWRQVP